MQNTVKIFLLYADSQLGKIRASTATGFAVWIRSRTAALNYGIVQSPTPRWRLDPKTWTENKQYIHEHLGKKKGFFLPFGTPGFAFKLGLLTRKQVRSKKRCVQREDFKKI